MSALVEQFEFDPLAPVFMGRFIASLDYDQRRALMARGGSGGGFGRGSRRGTPDQVRGRLSRRSRSAPLSKTELRNAKEAVRRAARSAKASARGASRESARLRDELAYRRRVFRASIAAQREQFREFEQQIKEQERHARALERAEVRHRQTLAKFLTPASKRTAYQKRVVSRVTRQVASGEPISARPERGTGATPRGSKVNPFDRSEPTAQRLKAYIQKLFRDNTQHGNWTTDMLLELPKGEQLEYLEQATERNEASVANDGKPLGLNRHPWIMYHND